VKVWIDIANAPHVRFFGPIERRLRERGHEVLLTARDHRETAVLAREAWPEVLLDSGSSPNARAAKAAAIARRVIVLARWARRVRPDVALSHNSYAQVVAARVCGIPSVTAMDYEHQPANHVAFRLASRVVVPEVFPADALRRFGAAARKVRRYAGVKEELYVDAATPTVGERNRLGVPADAPLVVLRLPPDGALYHRSDNDLVGRAVETLRGRGATIVVLARASSQRNSWRGRADATLIVPDPPVDTRSLLLESDLFVGAGGTMTREAAVLGIPAWSIFAGRPAAVDGWLHEQGRLELIDSPELLATLPFPNALRSDPLLPDRAGGPLAVLLAAVDEVA
jgi:uncharacterized protein